MVELTPPLTPPPSQQPWFASPLGRYLLDRELSYAQQAVSNIFGFYALQIGSIKQSYLRGSRIQHCWQLGASPSDCIAAPEYLPFFDNTFDLIVLPHVLEFADDPHQVLREVHRVLRAEGHMLLIGFNPCSLWGAKRYLWPEANFPWYGQFIGLYRIRDWLKLLGFEVIAGQFDCYVPPCNHPHWLERLRFFEAAGDRWWPIAGGVYFLHSVKKIAGAHVIKPAWEHSQPHKKRALSPATCR